MQHQPVIRAAVPKRRYSLGDFSVVVLGDIESGDGKSYQYILAVLREGEPEPGLYLTAERDPPRGGAEGSVAMRLVMEDGSEVLGRSDHWIALEGFTEGALTVVRRILALGDQEAFRLL
jgi:hypothetical protein